MIEKGEAVGGFARTLTFADFRFDIGGRRFHSHKPEIIEWIQELILRHHAFVNDLNLQTGNRASVILVWLIILCLAGTVWQGWLLAPACLFALVLSRLNWPLYRWLAEKRS